MKELGYCSTVFWVVTMQLGDSLTYWMNILLPSSGSKSKPSMELAEEGCELTQPAACWFLASPPKYTALTIPKTALFIVTAVITSNSTWTTTFCTNVHR
jgi:hypothetical protein